MFNSIAKWVYKSKRGSVNGKYKHYNQDAFILTPKFGGVKGQYIFGVCDGHGKNGHDVAGFLQQKIPEFMAKNFPKNIEDSE